MTRHCEKHCPDGCQHHRKPYHPEHCKHACHAKPEGWKPPTKKAGDSVNPDDVVDIEYLFSDAMSDLQRLYNVTCSYCGDVISDGILTVMKDADVSACQACAETFSPAEQANSIKMPGSFLFKGKGIWSDIQPREIAIQSARDWIREQECQ